MSKIFLTSEKIFDNGSFQVYQDHYLERELESVLWFGEEYTFSFEDLSLLVRFLRHRGLLTE